MDIVFSTVTVLFSNIGPFLSSQHSASTKSVLVSGIVYQNQYCASILPLVNSYLGPKYLVILNLGNDRTHMTSCVYYLILLIKK